jgi:alpha-tubulin suppressor-like RCC1 family protein
MHVRVLHRRKIYHTQGVGSNTTITDVASKSIAVKFGTFVTPIAMSVGYYHTCARTNGPGTATNGSLYCWGQNDVGQLGMPANQVLHCILLNNMI